jgi:hypothetical protein
MRNDFSLRQKKKKNIVKCEESKAEEAIERILKNCNFIKFRRGVEEQIS